jgi:hypothetical protein
MSPLAINKFSRTKLNVLYEAVVPIALADIDYLESKTDENSRVVAPDKHLYLP